MRDIRSLWAASANMRSVLETLLDGLSARGHREAEPALMAGLERPEFDASRARPVEADGAPDDARTRPHPFPDDGWIDPAFRDADPVFDDGGGFAASISPVAATGDHRIDGLFFSSRWSAAAMTFSFPAQASFYGPVGGYSANNEHDNNFGALNAAQMAAARDALGFYAAISDLDFTEITETATTHAQLRFGLSLDPPTAHAYVPSAAATGGDIWFRNDGTYDAPTLGSFAHHTFMHEVGHALGLKHGHESSVFGALPAEWDSGEFSVMTYRSYIGKDLDAYAFATNSAGHFAQSLMMLDIRAIQELYGPAWGQNADDTIYTFDPATGEMSINGVGQGAPGENVIYRTIWDGAGTDTYDFSNFTQNQVASLNPGGWSRVSDPQLAWINRYGDQAFDTHTRANVFNALMHDNDPGSLIENLITGSGDDSLEGNQAANTLDGGAGLDRVVFHLDPGGVSVDLGAGAATDGWGQTDTLINIEHVDGSEFNDTLIGDDAANTLNGENGADTLKGAAGDDILLGGAAGDLIEGGAGDDDLRGEVGDDLLRNLGGGSDSLNGGAGDDTLEAWDDGAITAIGGGEIDTFELKADDLDLTGSSFADIEYMDFNGFSVTVDPGVLETIGVLLVVDTIRHSMGGSTDLTGQLALGDAGAFAGSSGDDIFRLTDVTANWTMTGNDGADELFAGLGNDQLRGGLGDDYLDGGAGHDNLSGESSAGGGSSGAGHGDDRLYGREGNDTLLGGGGDDILEGGAGTDTLHGDFGRDILLGGGGDDSLYLRDADTLLHGGGGFDTVFLQSDNDFSGTIFKKVEQIKGILSGVSIQAGQIDRIKLLDIGTIQLTTAGVSVFGPQLNSNHSLGAITGHAGADDITLLGKREWTVNAGEGDDIVRGTRGDDTLRGGAGQDQLVGSSGNDVIEGGADDDLIAGDDGADILRGDAGADDIRGGRGKDDLFGGEGDDTMRGGDRADELFGEAGDDTLFGDGGKDVLFGGDGDDYMEGNINDDRLIGGDGEDVLDGGDGVDVLKGGAHQDRLIGGSDKDVLFGGSGGDTFVYFSVNDSGTTGLTRDKIRDFSEADLIDLSNVDADANTAGDQAFTLVAAFSGTAGEMVWDNASDLLSMDVDGDGVADMQIEIRGNFTLDASDFIL